MTYQDSEAQAVKHKSFAPWLVALVCFGPFAVGAIHLLRAARALDGCRSCRAAASCCASPCRCRSSGRRAEGLAEAAHPWQLIYARMTPCEQQCAQHLGRLLQVQLALGRDLDRVQRVVWHVGSLPQLDDRELLAFALDEAAGRSMVAALGAERLGEGRVYVADPRGLVVLSYPPDVEQKELLRDLKRLLAGSDS